MTRDARAEPSEQYEEFSVRCPKNGSHDPHPVYGTLDDAMARAATCRRIGHGGDEIVPVRRLVKVRFTPWEDVGGATIDVSMKEDTRT
jgi:hypothetical protein